MPRSYPVEFRARAIALVRAGKPATVVAGDLGVSTGCLQNWVRRDRIDRGEIEGIARSESVEMRRARKRIRELEREVEILCVASKLLGEQAPHPIGFTR